MKRICPECGEQVTGRSDKIYCCDSCRVNHFNKEARAIANAARAQRREPNNFVKFCELGIFANCLHFSKK